MLLLNRCGAHECRQMRISLRCVKLARRNEQSITSEIPEYHHCIA